MFPMLLKVPKKGNRFNESEQCRKFLSTIPVNISSSPTLKIIENSLNVKKDFNQDLTKRELHPLNRLFIQKVKIVLAEECLPMITMTLQQMMNTIFEKLHHNDKELKSKSVSKSLLKKNLTKL
ncbi:CLUMA_CG002820, isoform A [Clunio marinus]|uniref:CLUMA_CG002820, isoform A n=1 Tax=Clunio marinus TaxID=568069 RepID=A0A1J1HM74_9DIPT|nr:CLUMA_CG002820, isoform A [Clunio marinus]